MREQARRRLTSQWVHAHVERTFILEGGAAVRVVELHRRHAEVGKNHVRGGELFFCQDFRQAGEIALANDERVGVKPGRAHAVLGSRQLQRIDVESDQPSARLKARQDGARVSAEAERAIDSDFSRFRDQGAQHFIDHDRAMRSCRRLTRRDDFLHVGRVAVGIQLFVLLGEPARILAGVSRTALSHSHRRVMLARDGYRCINVFARPLQTAVGRGLRTIARLLTSHVMGSRHGKNGLSIA
jgi:hypothetical protein